MSIKSPLFFPNGHTLDQVKRNAKRISKDREIPLNKALDIAACLALGFPENSIRWPMAKQALEISRQYFFYDVDAESLLGRVNDYMHGAIVSLDVKDAYEFDEKDQRGDWEVDEDLKLLMSPALLLSYALVSADEEDRKTPNEGDWEHARYIYMDSVIYKDKGGTQFKDRADVIRDICDRNYFPPDEVWLDGIMLSLPYEILS